MKRRLFLKSSAVALVAAPAIASANAPHPRATAASRVFYDHRFGEARNLALALDTNSDGGRALTPVNGDITSSWVSDLGLLSPTAALRLRGVTTESFYFCIKTLLQPRGLSVARIERVTRDLQAWEIRTHPIQQDRTA